MRYTVELTAPNTWLIGDKPNLSGIVRADGVDGAVAPNFIYGTIRLNWPGGIDTVAESLVNIGTDGKFSFDLAAPITNQRSGKIFVSVFPDSLATAQLNGAINSSVLTANIDTIVGSIPLSGYLLIDGEAMWYNYDGVSTLTIIRSQYQTAAASHLDNAPIKFASVKETCIPQDFEYIFRDPRTL